MGTITLTNTLTNGTVADADEVMENLEDITNECNGSLDADNLDLSNAGAIGGTTPAAGAFTTLAASSTAAITGNTTLGGTLAVTGATTFKKTVQTIVTATGGEPITFNLSLGNIQQVTLVGNRTLALSNVSVGQCFILNLIQDGTGSRTVTWFTTIKWADGSAPTLTTTATKIDTLGFICTSAGNYSGYIVGQNL